MKTFTHAVFDFDGVVADTERVFADFDCALLNDVLRQAGVAADLVAADIRAMAGNGGSKKLSIIAEDKRFDPAPYRDAFVENRTEKRKTLFADHPVSTGQNIHAFLDALCTPYALATNKSSAKLFHDMALMGLSDMFDIIVPCDPPLMRKPAPDLLIAAMALIDAAADSSVYIGDNMLDMEAARAAGMIPVGFIIEGMGYNAQRARDLTEAGAAIVIDDFADLIPYIDP